MIDGERGWEGDARVDRWISSRYLKLLGCWDTPELHKFSWDPALTVCPDCDFTQSS